MMTAFYLLSRSSDGSTKVERFHRHGQ